MSLYAFASSLLLSWAETCIYPFEFLKTLFETKPQGYSLKPIAMADRRAWSPLEDYNNFGRYNPLQDHTIYQNQAYIDPMNTSTSFTSPQIHTDGGYFTLGGSGRLDNINYPINSMDAASPTHWEFPARTVDPQGLSLNNGTERSSQPQSESSYFIPAQRDCLSFPNICYSRRLEQNSCK